MKHILLLFAFWIISAIPAFCQTGYFQYGDYNCNFGNSSDVKKSNDGNLVALFSTMPMNATFIKLDYEGNIIWSFTSEYLYFHPSFFHKITCVPGDGYYVIVGHTFLHISEDGTLLTQIDYNSADFGLPDFTSSIINDVLYTGSGFTCILSYQLGSDTDEENYYMKLNLDLDGSILSVSHHLVSSGSSSSLSNVSLYNNGGYDFICYSMQQDLVDARIIDKTTEGTCDIINSDTDYVYYSMDGMAKVDDGYIIYSSFPQYFLKIDMEGEVLWTKYFNDTSYTYGAIFIVGVQQMASGNLMMLLGGFAPSPGAPHADFFYFSPDGDSLLTVYNVYTNESDVSRRPLAAMEMLGTNLLAFSGTANDSYQPFILITDTLGNYYHVNLTGKLYHDANSNGNYDSDETVFSSALVKSEPLTYYGYTNESGDYNMLIGKDTTFTISVNPVSGWDIIDPDPLAFIATAAMDGDSVNGNDFTLDYSAVLHNVSVSVHLTPVVPGFASSASLTIKNTGNQYDEAGTVTLHFPFILSYTETTPDYLTLVDTIITWSYSDLDPYESQIFNVEFLADTLLYMIGETIITTAEVTTTSGGETDLADNTANSSVIITSAFDPNHITVSPAGLGTEGDIIHTTEYLTYIIEFQNTGTAPTHFIKVCDTLDNFLDMESIEMLAASNDYELSLTSPNVLCWKFDPIALTDSATDLLGSMGYLKYRVKIKDEAAIGDVIENKAGIYFDYNPAVLTNTVKNRLVATDAIETNEGNINTFNVYPNPAAKYITLDLVKPAYVDHFLIVNDISGKVLLISEIKKGVNSVTLDVSKLPAGSYTITLYNNANVKLGSEHFEVI